jgi:predicted dehydrogenase
MVLNHRKDAIMLRIGIVGFGFMGRMHYANWGKCEDAKVVAICDSDPDIIENSKKAGGNIAGADQAVDFDALTVYSDYDKMLADNGVDAVSITLPTFLHEAFSIKALEAGIHVLCEKPMALEIEACERMIKAANKSGKILQIGHCIRFWPEYVKAKEIVDSGEYGAVISATFKRLGCAPNWGAGNWFTQDDRSGGVALDLHIHDSDYVQYLFGVPKGVAGFGYPASGQGMKCITTRYSYDDDKVVTAEGSWAMSPSFGFEMSFNIVMEKATLMYDCSRTPAFKVCPVDGDAFTPDVTPGDGYSLEIDHFAGSVRGETLKPVITLEQSADSIRIVRAEIESIQNKCEIRL